MPTVERHKHKRPPTDVLFKFKSKREDGVRSSTKKKVGRRIIATGENERTTFELHATKGYRSQRKPIEEDKVITI